MRSTNTRRLLQRLVILTLLACSTAFAATQLPPHTPVPGGIAVLSLPAEWTAGNALPEAYYQNNRVLLAPPSSDSENKWTAVVGIPLSAKPGEHQLTIHNGKQTHQLDFEVSPKTYEEQHITLKNKRQVNPLAADLKRIHREKKIITDAFKHWEPSLQPELSFAMPVEGPLSSPFGLKRFFNDQPRNPHSGLDIAAPEGTPIKAPAVGIVRATGDYFFNGKTVFLDHGQGLVTMYCHLSEINVKEGQTVKSGELIGRVGKTGRVTGAHLHWSVSLNNARVAPNLLIN